MSLSDHRKLDHYRKIKPTWSITCDTNDIPNVFETTHATHRRLMMIEWAITIGEEERDEKFTEKLLQEASGILNWLIEGAHLYYTGALAPKHLPDAIRKSTAELWRSVDFTAQWMASECIKDPTVETNRKILYASYLQWLQENNCPPVTVRAFSVKLRAAKLAERETNGNTLFKGIRLRRDAEKAVLSSDETEAVEVPSIRKSVTSEAATPVTKQRRIM